MITAKVYAQFIENLEFPDIYDLILLNLAKHSLKFENDFELDTVDGDIDDIKEIHKIYRKLIRRKEVLDLYNDFIYTKSSTVN
jgi:hypothetical protein